MHFFILCLFAFVYLVGIFKIDKRNILIFVTLILSNPQNTLWQANFSPTIYFSILLLFNLNLKTVLPKILFIIIMLTFTLFSFCFDL